jgi:3-oxoadipate enol-lactonase
VPDLTLETGVTLHFEEDDFADPWRPHDTFVLLHGFAESSAAWFAWVPHLARRFRVVRPDLRGFGRSSIPEEPLDYPWSVGGFAEDLVALLDALEPTRVHLVGARLGAAIAMQIAADHPDRIASLSVISGLARGADVRGLDTGDELVALQSFADRIREDGLGAWFERSGRARLGMAASEGQLSYWNRLMARSDPEVCIAMMRAAARLDITESLGRIRAPTLVMASGDSRVQGIAATRAWQSLIPGSELVVVAGDSPHLAATEPDRCAQRVIAFAQRIGGIAAWA